MEKDFDTLISFGTAFQTKTITTLIKDPKFLEQIQDIIEEKYYDSDAHKWLIKVIKDYFGEYKKPPTMEVFKTELEKRVTSEVMKKTIIENLRNVYQNFEATDLQYIQENFLNFAKDQTMKQAIYDAVDMVNVKKYEEARNVIDKALKAGTTRDLGVIYKEEKFFQRRVMETLRSPISLPWDILNEILDGGLGSGELGIVVAPLGIGKCVGENTEIEIEYKEIGVDICNHTLWFKPWEKIFIDDKYMFLYEFANIISEYVEISGNGVGKSS